MKTYYITFRSVTYAQRGEQVLKKGGLSCVLQRTPRWMEEQGCGYALRLRMQEVTKAVQLLRENSVPLRRVYAQKGEGLLEEITV